jgi:hypothetical protein
MQDLEDDKLKLSRGGSALNDKSPKRSRQADENPEEKRRKGKNKFEA